MPEPSAFQVEMAIEKPKRQKSRDIDQIPVHLIKAGGMTIRSEIHFDLFRIRRNCMRSRRSRSLYLFIRRAIKHIVVIIGPYHIPYTNFYPISCCRQG